MLQFLLRDVYIRFDTMDGKLSEIKGDLSELVMDLRARQHLQKNYRRQRNPRTRHLETQNDEDEDEIDEDDYEYQETNGLSTLQLSGYDCTVFCEI